METTRSASEIDAVVPGGAPRMSVAFDWVSFFRGKVSGVIEYFLATGNNSRSVPFGIPLDGID